MIVYTIVYTIYYINLLIKAFHCKQLVAFGCLYILEALRNKSLYM